ncbi:hypothetical protein P8860_21800 [Bacillus spizizenii]|uniref:Uncharacterized protein n=1 Tax=Bacillus spizizenii TaxID=96241 RepID=A0A9Q4HF82_BACSC|nr:hypothetical protein [Bacillus spizizenii]MEC0581928.1 hypothetical protein [Bacillus spizizenii]MEC0631891.1 hypothetical protein [Bacillus spizizenii]
MAWKIEYIENETLVPKTSFLKSVLTKDKDKIMDIMKEELAKRLNKQEPPLGVIPKWLHDERRHKELKAAINRYLDDNREISAEWIDEYNLLVKSIKIKEENTNLALEDQLVDYQGLKVTKAKAELFKRLRIKFNLDAKSDLGYMPWGWDGVEYYGLAYLDPRDNCLTFRKYSKDYLESVSFKEMLKYRIRDENVREEILENVSEYKEDMNG